MAYSVYRIAVKGFVARIHVVVKSLQSWGGREHKFPQLHKDGDDEIGIIIGAINHLMIQLEVYHDELKESRQALHGTHEALLIQQKEQADEERIAKDVFSRIVSGSEEIPGIKQWAIPFAVFSGDLVLSAKDDKGATHCLLCDFTGHGLPAALGAMPVSAIYKTMVSRGMPGDVVLHELNNKLKDLLPTEYFCCAVYVVIDHENKCATIWNCGLPEVMIVGQGGEITSEIKAGNLPLGIVKTKAKYTAVSIPLNHGDSIYLCTDGITEAENMDGDMFGEAAYHRLLQTTDHGFGRINDIETSITQYMGKAPPGDDLSLVEIRFSE